MTAPQKNDPIDCNLVSTPEQAKALRQFNAESEAGVYALRRAVAIEATRKAHGYCGGQAEKAEHHVDNILPALCRCLGVTELDLVAMRRNSKQEG